MLSTLITDIRRPRRWAGTGRALTFAPGVVVVAVVLVVAAGCGGSSSKPAYCSDRSSLQNSVKGLSSAVTSSGISGLQSQIATIQSDATKLVSSAKSDFPSQASAVKTSVDTLASAVKALPSSPSTAQIAAIAVDASTVVSSVKSFTDATSSKCS